MHQGFIPVLTLSAVAAGPLAALRFVTGGGDYPEAGAGARGVTRSAAVAGERVPVDVVGVVCVEAGGAIAADDNLKVGDYGKAVALDEGTQVGIALGAAAGDGDVVEVLLTRATA